MTPPPSVFPTHQGCQTKGIPSAELSRLTYGEYVPTSRRLSASHCVGPSGVEAQIPQVMDGAVGLCWRRHDSDGRAFVIQAFPWGPVDSDENDVLCVLQEHIDVD